MDKEKKDGIDEQIASAMLEDYEKNVVDKDFLYLLNRIWPDLKSPDQELPEQIQEEHELPET